MLIVFLFGHLVRDVVFSILLSLSLSSVYVLGSALGESRSEI